VRRTLVEHISYKNVIFTIRTSVNLHCHSSNRVVTCFAHVPLARGHYTQQLRKMSRKNYPCGNYEAFVISAQSNTCQGGIVSAKVRGVRSAILSKSPREFREIS